MKLKGKVIWLPGMEVGGGGRGRKCLEIPKPIEVIQRERFK